VKVSQLAALAKQFGPGWVIRRSIYLAKIRSGSIRRRLPARQWSDEKFELLVTDSSLADPGRLMEYREHDGPRFLFSPADRQSYRPLFARWDTEGKHPITTADGIKDGVFPFFGHAEANCTFPPDWHRSALSGHRSPPTQHWSDIGDFEFGDVKEIWELSRFGHTFSLVRAYWRTGREAYAETFWQLVEHWARNNPPQSGTNWKCGQEASFRAMAWCFGLYGFLDAEPTTAVRVAQLVQMLAVTARRILANIEYALSQANNHGISEGVGLWTIGTLFPELREADRWQKRGRAVLEAQGRELIYDDGSFAQHSFNYHRLMLHDYVWSLRLADLNEVPFTSGLRERIGRAAEFLLQVQDDSSGGLPGYGHNDGALVLPLNNCDYSDFRPVISSTRFLACNARTYSPGAWDEDLLWLFGPTALATPIQAPERCDLSANQGGYYTLRSHDSFVFTRCATFKHRPAHADMLHVDLWWRGENIAIDAGTFSYNAPPPWDNPFIDTSVHNTVTVDGMGQMERAGRFLWLPWVNGKVRSFEHSDALRCFEGEHDGYMRLPVPVHYRRAIIALDDDFWLVLDQLDSAKEHEYRLHWLLNDFPGEFCPDTNRIALRAHTSTYYGQFGSLSSEAESSFVRADPQSVRGWRSRFYGEREPAISITLTVRRQTALFWSVFSPAKCTIEAVKEGLQIRSDEKVWTVRFADQHTAPLVTSLATETAKPGATWMSS
jgi:hypothetical protein